VSVNSVYGYLTWPGALNGKALDALSGTDTVFVTKHRDADGFEYNGPAWINTFTDKVRADSTFSSPLPVSALATGEYTFIVSAKDKLGNTSAPLTWHVHYDSDRAP